MRNTLTAIAASLLLALPAVAEEAHHPEQKTDAVPTTQAPATPAAKPPAAAQPVQQMQANVKKMDAQLKRIAKEKNEAERNRLLGEHMQTMRENMMLAGGMAGGCPMMGSGMGMMMGPGAGMMMGPGDMMERMQQMEKRMDMMQMMLEQQGMPPAK
jgi:hypothetical protein